MKILHGKNMSEVSFLFDFPEQLTMKAEQPKSIKLQWKKVCIENRRKGR